MVLCRRSNPMHSSFFIFFGLSTLGFYI
jgi:hypothetical protein